MVRIMTGTLIEVGQGIRQAEEIPGILEAKNRERAGFLNRRNPVVTGNNRIRPVRFCLRNQVLIDPIPVLHTIRNRCSHNAARPPNRCGFYTIRGDYGDAKRKMVCSGEARGF